LGDEHQEPRASLPGKGPPTVFIAESMTGATADGSGIFLTLFGERAVGREENFERVPIFSAFLLPAEAQHLFTNLDAAIIEAGKRAAAKPKPK